MTAPTQSDHAIAVLRADVELWQGIAKRALGREQFYRGLFALLERRCRQQQQTIDSQKLRIAALTEEIAIRSGVVK